MHIEFKKLTAMFKRNGYNLSFIQDIIKTFLNNKYSEYNKKSGCEQFRVFIKLPYLGEVSEKVKKSINSCLSRIKCGRVKVIVIYDYSTVGSQFPYKDRQPKNLMSNVVYKIKCNDCNSYYIGETGRCLYTRFQEHNKSSGSGLTEIGKHLHENPSHSIDFDNRCTIVKAGLDILWKRRFMETLILQDSKFEPNIFNDMQKSILLTLFNV